MYKKISLTRFLLAAIVVSIPAVILAETYDQKTAWAYVGLILLAIGVFYGDQISQFTSYIRKIK